MPRLTYSQIARLLARERRRVYSERRRRRLTRGRRRHRRRRRWIRSSRAFNNSTELRRRAKNVTGRVFGRIKARQKFVRISVKEFRRIRSEFYNFALRLFVMSDQCETLMRDTAELREERDEIKKKLSAHEYEKKSVDTPLNPINVVRPKDA